jgi:predicted AAA+ superfamily ATPase
MIYQRHIQPDILAALDKQKIVIMTGARQVGKTTLLKVCEHHLTDRWDQVTFLTLEDPLIRASLDTHPEQIFQYIPKLSKLQYVLIDEIQYLKDPTQFLKYCFDLHKDTLRLVVTGSSSFYIDQKFRDSLAGRKILFTIYPLSFAEYLEFKDSNKTILTQAIQWSYPAKQEVMRNIYDYLIYGGYPECVLFESYSDKQSYLKQLVQTYVSKDIDEAWVEYRDKYLRLMKLMASQIGNLVNKSELSNTLNLSAPIVDKYLYVMQKSYHLLMVTPFYGNNIRNELTKMPKVYFYDTWLRNALLGVRDHWDSRIDQWALLENFCLRQLLNNYDLNDIHFWRSKKQEEVDFVVQEKQAFEVKHNKDKFVVSKYGPFTTKYPHIPLTPIDLRDTIAL